MDDYRINTSQEYCTFLLKKRGWDWEHPRVVNWLKRVQKHYQWNADESLPPFVYDGLARFIKLRFECERQLLEAGIDWNNIVVKKIEARFGCDNNLPLKGYQYLNQVLSKYLESFAKANEKEVLF